MTFPVHQGHTVAERTPAGDASDVRLTVAKPAGVVTGDLMLASGSARNQGNITLGAPVGWNIIFEVSVFNGVYLFAAWKESGVSEPAFYDWTFFGTTRTNIVGINRITGHKPTDPIDLFATDNDTSAMAVAPSVNTTVPETLVYRSLAFERNNSLTTDPGTTIVWSFNAHDSGNAGASERHWTACEYQTFPSAGPTGTHSWSNNSFRWATSTIAIQPPTGPQPVKPFVYNRYYRQILAG